MATFNAYWEEEEKTNINRKNILDLIQDLRSNSRFQKIPTALMIKNQSGDLFTLVVGCDYSYCIARIDGKNYALNDHTTEIELLEFSMLSHHSLVDNEVIVKYEKALRYLMMFLNNKNFTDDDNWISCVSL